MKCVVKSFNGIVESVTYEPETKEEAALLTPAPLTITPAPLKGKGKGANS